MPSIKTTTFRRVMSSTVGILVTGGLACAIIPIMHGAAAAILSHASGYSFATVTSAAGLVRIDWSGEWLVDGLPYLLEVHETSDLDSLDKRIVSQTRHVAPGAIESHDSLARLAQAWLRKTGQAGELDVLERRTPALRAKALLTRNAASPRLAAGYIAYPIDQARWTVVVARSMTRIPGSHAVVSVFPELPSSRVVATRWGADGSPSARIVEAPDEASLRQEIDRDGWRVELPSGVTGKSHSFCCVRGSETVYVNCLGGVRGPAGTLSMFVRLPVEPGQDDVGQTISALGAK